MRILTIDTTSDWGGAAIFEDDVCLAAVATQANYAVTLFEAVKNALAKAHLRLDEIDLYAAANGPGSFTGIRVGLAAVQGWAQAFAKPAHGVSVLEAMADESAAPYALPLLDARRGEFYARLFRLDQREPTAPQGPKVTPQPAPLTEGVILKPQRILAFLESEAPPEARCTLVVRENDHEAIALERSLPASLEWKIVHGFLFSAIARLAAATAGGKPSALRQDLTAYYIRRPDAEINWKQ